MSIVFDSGRPVKAVRRPFEAGLLAPPGPDDPADDPPPPGSPDPAGRPAPFDPSPDDRAWWAAESDRLDAARRARADRRARPPAWPCSRTDRLRARLDHARGLEADLRRERCALPGRTDLIAALDARLAALARRVGRLAVAVRAAARLDRHYDRLAAESYATDALCRGLIPRDLAADLMATSLIGHPE
jgi:hypothetical protein